MIARYACADGRYYLTDALNSVMAQTRSNRSIQNYYIYSPYGGDGRDWIGRRKPNVSDTARENDQTGLYYYRARYYDPTLKRFISEDPIGLAAGPNKFQYHRWKSSISERSIGAMAGVDDAVFTVGGAVVGVVGQGLSDLLSWNLSGWEDYVGSAVGGAAFGETLLYSGPVIAAQSAGQLRTGRNKA